MPVMKTFDNEFKLSRLPISILQKASLYLKSIQPLTKNENVNSAYYDSFVKIFHFSKWVKFNSLTMIISS